MGEARQKTQLQLAFMAGAEGETPRPGQPRADSPVARHGTERPMFPERLMEEIVREENAKQALKRVQRNHGQSGVDGMIVESLGGYLNVHWVTMKKELLEGRYQPAPVKRVEIPKPGGGMRKLGIPTVRDRLIQQMVLQVLQRGWDRTFSLHSYGFRPGRSAHQAVAQAQQYLAEGYGMVVDIDLEKCFDRINHDMLMSRIAKWVTGKRVQKLIRAYLNAGVMENGLVSPMEEGTPQGGPLSPLLSNIVLDDLDRELEKRGHRFVRYADDATIYVKSERAGRRVMESITNFIAQAHGELDEERGSPAPREEVSGIQLYRGKGGKAEDRPVCPGPLQEADSETDESEPRKEYRVGSEGDVHLSEGMGRLLWVQPDLLRTQGLGLMDETAAAVSDLETMEDSASTDSETEKPKGQPQPSRADGDEPSWSLPNQPQQCRSNRIAQCLLRHAWIASIGSDGTHLTSRTAVYGPVRTVV